MEHDELRANYDMLWRDYQTVRKENAELRQSKTEPAKKGGGFVSFLCGMIMIALAVIGGYFLLVIYLDPAPAPTSAPTASARPTVASGGSTTFGVSSSAPRTSLPPCSAVTDTRTACVQEEGTVQAAEDRQLTPAPTGTPEPQWVSVVCLTPPGARPCWLAEGEPWEPPASVPETPIVLVQPPPLVFSDSACAAWRPPLAYPEGCPTGGDE